MAVSERSVGSAEYVPRWPTSSSTTRAGSENPLILVPRNMVVGARGAAVGWGWVGERTMSQWSVGLQSEAAFAPGRGNSAREGHLKEARLCVFLRH